jgi:hypothetical protein
VLQLRRNRAQFRQIHESHLIQVNRAHLSLLPRLIRVGSSLSRNESLFTN